jgi:PII-like signaling protein
MDAEVMVVRIYIREADHGRRKTLMEEILRALHDQHRVQGVVVFRGIAGLDGSGEIYAADMLRLNVDLPIVVEFFDTPEAAEAALALLDGLVPAGHVLSWRATRRGGQEEAAPAAS